MTHTLDPHVKEAIRLFSDVCIDGIPRTICDPTAFLGVICILTATDALAGYRYKDRDPDRRFKKFLRNYFPKVYAPHIKDLWVFRCRMVHSFSPAHFSLVHHHRELHLTASRHGDTTLNADDFYKDFAKSAKKFFEEVKASKERHDQMLRRLLDIDQGGAIFVE